MGHEIQQYIHGNYIEDKNEYDGVDDEDNNNSDNQQQAIRRKKKKLTTPANTLYVVHNGKKMYSNGELVYMDGDGKMKKIVAVKLWFPIHHHGQASFPIHF